jgi:hypothetical protein
MLIIYVALKCCGPVTHRELMNAVVLVQGARILSQIEDISKTKIRALFCMLKNSRAMIKADGEGESVKIHFGKGITSFRQFRERQDSFINKCCTLQQICIPYEMKGDIIWQLDSVTMSLRVEELRLLEEAIQEFLLGHILNSNRRKTPGSFHHSPVSRDSYVNREQSSFMTDPASASYRDDYFQQYRSLESVPSQNPPDELFSHYSVTGYHSSRGLSLMPPDINYSGQRKSFAAFSPRMPEAATSQEANYFRADFQSTALFSSQQRSFPVQKEYKDHDFEKF